jgi:iron complex outermembrane receptor protein
LANGYVPSYTTTDAQVTYHLPAIVSTIKLGASNIFNKYYNQYIGGPSVGGFYYMTYVLDIVKKDHDSK